MLSDETWQKVRGCGTAKAIREALQLTHAPQTVIDIFQIRCTDDEVSLKVRILTSDLQAWMTATLPFSVNPVGEIAEQHKIVWDPSVQTLTEARQQV